MDRRFQEVNHESQENKVQTLSHEPLQKLPIHRISTTDREHAGGVKLKQALVYTPKPKYQFYPRGNIKDRRDLGRGWIFWTPSPCLNVSLSSVCASFRVGKGLFDLPVQV